MIVCMTKVEEFYTSRKIVVIYFLHRVPLGDKQNFERGGVKEGGPNVTGRREGGGSNPSAQYDLVKISKQVSKTVASVT